MKYVYVYSVKNPMVFSEDYKIVGVFSDQREALNNLPDEAHYMHNLGPLGGIWEEKVVETYGMHHEVYVVKHRIEEVILDDLVNA